MNRQTDFGFQNTHYGSPVITPQNTVIVPVRDADGGFSMQAHRGSDGTLLWQLDSDWTLPPSYDWTLPFQIVLANSNSVAMAGAGGTVIVQTNPNTAGGTVTRYAFYGINNYNANPDAYNSSVQIITPITSDGNGVLYFGFLATNAPGGLTSGLARLDLKSPNTGIWTTAAAASGDPTMQKVAYNCGPALSLDLSRVYFSVNNVSGFADGAAGYLCSVDGRSLARVASVRLKDPGYPQNDALFFDDSTASPTVGPDGDVYYGVLENPFPYANDRGWMLHFSGDLENDEDPRRLRLGHHALDRPGQRRSLVHRPFELPDPDQVQQLRRPRYWRRRQSSRGPGPECRGNRSDHRLPGHAAGLGRHRPDP